MQSQTWTSVEELPPIMRRHRSQRVIVDLVSPGTELYRRVNLRFPQPWMMVVFEPFTAKEAVNSDRFETACFPNRSHLLPAETTLSLDARKRRPEFLAIHVDGRFAKATLEEQLEGKPLREQPVVRNARPSLLRLCKALRNQILEGRRLGALQLESFAVLCLAEWLDDLKATPSASASGGSRLASLSRVDDYIMAHLDQDLTLTDLAKVAGLSPSYFLRAFKSATGRTPHRHLMERRVQQACELLRRTDLPLTEITYSCGFASQSHMTDVFKRHLDISPGRYRRMLHTRSIP